MTEEHLFPDLDEENKQNGSLHVPLLQSSGELAVR